MHYVYSWFCHGGLLKVLTYSLLHYITILHDSLDPHKSATSYWIKELRHHSPFIPSNFQIFFWGTLL